MKNGMSQSGRRRMSGSKESENREEKMKRIENKTEIEQVNYANLNSKEGNIEWLRGFFFRVQFFSRGVVST